MGLLARFLEERGIPTASVYLQRGMVESVPAPRMLLLRWPFGHPFGEPNQPALQATVFHRLMQLFEVANAFGYLDDPDWPWRRTKPQLPEDWEQVRSWRPA